MEELIKFLPIALYVAYKLFGGGKKKKQKPNSRPKATKRKSSETTTPSIEDILRELKGEKPVAREVEQPIEEQPVYETLSQQRERKKLETKDHQYDFRPEYEHHADVKLDLEEVRTEIAKAQGIQRIETKETQPIQFDLRQAIVAQTILNRPEY